MAQARYSGPATLSLATNLSLETNSRLALNSALSIFEGSNKWEPSNELPVRQGHLLTAKSFASVLRLDSVQWTPQKCKAVHNAHEYLSQLFWMHPANELTD